MPLPSPPHSPHKGQLDTSSTSPSSHSKTPLFGFFDLIGPAKVAGLDQELRDEIIPYIKQFGALPNEIQTEAFNAASSLKPSDYLAELIQAWKVHNELAHEIDNYLISINLNVTLAAAPENIARLCFLLGSAITTERKKRIYSAGVKIALERYFQWARNRYNLNDSDFFDAITPPKTSFFIAYYFDHLDYISRKREDLDISQVHESLCQRYHAGSPALLESRLNSTFNHISSSDCTVIYNIKNKLSNSIISIQSRRTNSFYATIGRHELRSIQGIIQYDNCEEYEFGYNHYGTPDLFLRRLFINVCLFYQLVEPRTGVLSYSDSELLQASKKLINKSENNLK